MATHELFPGCPDLAITAPFRLTFGISLPKAMVPLTGFEPVTPSLRMEITEPTKTIYSMDLSPIYVPQSRQFQALPKLG